MMKLFLKSDKAKALHRYLPWKGKSKPALSFISVYYQDYELAISASEKFRKILKMPIYIYKEQLEDDVYFYITSNVKCGNDYIHITTL